jgi:hypothetical protein
VRPTEATRSAVKQTGSPEAGAQAFDRSETDEVRVLVRRREMAETGPTHRASRRSKNRKANRRRGAGPGVLRRRADAHGGDLQGENGARVLRRFQTRWHAGLGGRRQLRSIETRWKASRSALLQHRKVRQGDGLGRTGQRETLRRKTERRASRPSVLEPTRRCPSGDIGASEIGDVRGEGCSSRRGASGRSSRGTERCRSSKKLRTRASRSMRKRHRDRGESRTGQSKLARANS